MKKSSTTSRKNSPTGNKKVLKKKEITLIYSFGNKKAEGSENQVELLGGKGAHLHSMTKLGLPVPPGFTISTELCTYFYQNKKAYPSGFEDQLKSAVRELEEEMNQKFGGNSRPLLVSVRSGARASMPGMMDTILNLGLNDETVLALARTPESGRFAYDSYRRLISMYSDVVLGIHLSEFEAALEDIKATRGVELDTDLTAEDLENLVQKYHQIVRAHGHEFPQDPWKQLWGAISAVLNSWKSARAITYRKLNSIPEEWGTAVNVQSMVFGNKGPNCATGVAFTRDPSTGEKKYFGEFLMNAQGEDVVAGIRTPQPINAYSQHASSKKLPTLEEAMPKIYRQLTGIFQQLETHYRDLQDIEFTIEENKLYILQTRSGKRTAAAALKIVVDMVNEGLISQEEAILRIKPEQLDQLLHPCLDPHAKKHILVKGLPASPGAASGQIVFNPEVAQEWVNSGKKVILVRQETSPEDIQGMAVSEGILTARGGMTSHAAVVARGMGKSCVSGCSSLRIDEKAKEAQAGTHILKEGDYITLDGSTGEVIQGQVATITPTMNQNFEIFMRWVDSFRKMEVRTNADNPADAKLAREFGAQGIGLCRTEHMFFESHRIDVVREMILADSPEKREQCLTKILPMQKADFKAIFREMKGKPVTIRLLDPPLHEFIPREDTEIRALSKKLEISYERLNRKIQSLAEVNPMLGHRGCRLGISFPEIYKTQVRAIAEAACELIRDEGFTLCPEIMVPLIGDYRELKWIREYCVEEMKNVISLFGIHTLDYKIGTMIETPRAALTASEIALHADFFSFGTNDLTQTTYGLSRDDSALFLKDYLDAKIYDGDPFASLDPAGVGKLLKWALTEGRSVKPDLKVGICGEQGGDPSSISFCHALGLDYVSCSPFRVPIARLALAQAELKNLEKNRSKRKVRTKTKILTP